MFQVEDLFEVGLKQGVVRFFAGFSPYLLRDGSYSGEFFDEGSGQFDSSIVVPADFSRVDCGFGMGVGDQVAVFYFFKPVANLRGGYAFVYHAHEQCELLGAMPGPAFGHVGLFVPTQYTGTGSQ